MVNNDAIKFLDYYIQQTPGNFSDDKITFATNVAVSLFLRNEFQKGDITGNRLFQWAFSAFYGMGVVSSEGEKAFFEKMESLRDAHSDLNAREITEGLKPEMGKNCFSFATKMLNLLDDTNYPIYDSQVAVVFQKPFTPEETRLDHQCLIYQDIIDTYKSLENHQAIALFRNRFNCPELGYMKVLDTIFWKLGRWMEDNAEEFPWR